MRRTWGTPLCLSSRDRFPNKGFQDGLMRDVKHAKPPASLSPGAHALLPVPIANAGALLVWGQHPHALAGAGRNCASPKHHGLRGRPGRKGKRWAGFSQNILIFWVLPDTWILVLCLSQKAWAERVRRGIPSPHEEWESFIYHSHEYINSFVLCVLLDSCELTALPEDRTASFY